MARDPASQPVEDNPARGRYELRVGDDVAFVTYHREPGRITFLHTEVPPALEDHGVGSRLAQVALDAARAEGLAVIPSCPFVAGYIRRHPAYADLVSTSRRQTT
jgi:uncharacterized protein